jgi:hypothetical protein
MILDEYLPRTHRLAVAIALARTTIDDRGALLALAVSLMAVKVSVEISLT